MNILNRLTVNNDFPWLPTAHHYGGNDNFLPRREEQTGFRFGLPWLDSRIPLGESPGITVISGATGSGKTALLNTIKKNNACWSYFQIDAKTEILIVCKRDQQYNNARLQKWHQLFQNDEDFLNSPVALAVERLMLPTLNWGIICFQTRKLRWYDDPMWNRLAGRPSMPLIPIGLIYQANVVLALEGQGRLRIIKNRFNPIQAEELTLRFTETPIGITAVEAA